MDALLEREAPLAALARARDAAAAGSGCVVLVTGEPGIGKSALVAALARDPGGARVLVGLCDDLSTPRPLGPLRDLAAALPGLPADPAAVHDRVLALLAGPPAPTVLVLEDVHWADDATVDLVRTVGRRIGRLPAVLVLTCRDGEVPADAPLRAALAAVPARHLVRLPLAPLSEDAVATLVGDDAARVHAVTGGNPFYVTELAAARPAGLPPSVAGAVAGRVAVLAPAARELLELVAVVPSRTATAVLDLAEPGWEAAAEEPERRGLLQVTPGWVRFRHELARTAVEAGLTAGSRRRLHARVLGALTRLGADPAELVHHAEAAGDSEALAAAALPAARRAAALGAHREAHAHYRRAAWTADRLPAGERAALLEELAGAAYLVGRIPEALAAVDAAAAAHGPGDVAAQARCARLRSRLHWYSGDGPAARREARAAVALLAPLGDSVELARAAGSLAQLAMLAGRSAEALREAGRAVDGARRSGDRPTEAHALVTIGVVRAHDDPDDVAGIEAAEAAAQACGDAHEAVRAVVGGAWAQLMWLRPDRAREQAERGLALATATEVDALGAYLEVTLAWLRARAGEDGAAVAVAAAAAERGATVTQLLARTVLAETAVRRGAPDAARQLAAVAAQADRTGELQRIVPVLELQVEVALLSGGPMPVDAVTRALALAEDGGRRQWGAGRLAAVAALAGVPDGWRGPAAPASAAVIAGDPAAAADAHGAAGWRYDRALLLSLLDDPAALREALETARALGAGPLAARVARRMRALGLAVRHGRRGTTRTNPAGLTDRQAEVARLLAAGLTNAEIAAALVVSPRTAEHHVAAVLAKLGVGSRRDAARRAASLGLVSS
ncbi:ATP-binding protein [Blastococcus sp. SYSU D00820]